MSEIQKLTNTIRNYSESDLCYGTLVTLKKIDNACDSIIKRYYEENKEDLKRRKIKRMRDELAKFEAICEAAESDERL